MLQQFLLLSMPAIELHLKLSPSFVDFRLSFFPVQHTPYHLGVTLFFLSHRLSFFLSGLNKFRAKGLDSRVIDLDLEMFGGVTILKLSKIK
jgi:hypothetical protein